MPLFPPVKGGSHSTLRTNCNISQPSLHTIFLWSWGMLIIEMLIQILFPKVFCGINRITKIYSFPENDFMQSLRLCRAKANTKNANLYKYFHNHYQNLPRNRQNINGNGTGNMVLYSAAWVVWSVQSWWDVCTNTALSLLRSGRYCYWLTMSLLSLTYLLRVLLPEGEEVTGVNDSTKPTRKEWIAGQQLILYVNSIEA